MRQSIPLAQWRRTHDLPTHLNQEQLRGSAQISACVNFIENPHVSAVLMDLVYRQIPAAVSQSGHDSGQSGRRNGLSSDTFTQVRLDGSDTKFSCLFAPAPEFPPAHSAKNPLAAQQKKGTSLPSHRWRNKYERCRVDIITDQ